MRVTPDSIEQVGRSLGRAARAHRVILFGSRASGGARSDSDVDFLVIADSSLPRHKRSRPLYAMFRPYPFPMDIIVFTPEEVALELKKKGSFIASALAQGREIYVG